MKAKWMSLGILTAVALVLGGCAVTDGGTGSPTDIEEDAVGKADSTDGVELVPADEKLRSTTLRKMICVAIGNDEMWTSAEKEACPQRMTFHITQFAISKKYLHADGHPVTMEMLLDVGDTQGDQTWGARLSRSLGTGYVMRWGAEVTTGSHAGDIHDFIRALADDVGEYPRYGEDEYSDRVRLVQFSEFPEAFRTDVEERVSDLHEEMNLERPGQAGAELADELHGMIVKDGEVVGYIVAVWYWIDDSLFDGGGVTWYFDLQGRLVTDVEWWG